MVDKIKSFMGKNSQVWYIVIFLIVTLVTGKMPAGSPGDLSISDVISTSEDGGDSLLMATLRPVIEEVIQDNNDILKAEIMAELDTRFDAQELKELGKDIDEIALALSEIRTRDQLDTLLLFWHDEKWTKKITAINNIGDNPQASAKLRELLYFFSDELFERLMTYYK